MEEGGGYQLRERKRKANVPIEEDLVNRRSKDKISKVDEKADREEIIREVGEEGEREEKKERKTYRRRSSYAKDARKKKNKANYARGRRATSGPTTTNNNKQTRVHKKGEGRREREKEGGPCTRARSRHTQSLKSTKGKLFKVPGVGCFLFLEEIRICNGRVSVSREQWDGLHVGMLPQPSHPTLEDPQVELQEAAELRLPEEAALKEGGAGSNTEEEVDTLSGFPALNNQVKAEASNLQFVALLSLYLILFCHVFRSARRDEGSHQR